MKLEDQVVSLDLAKKMRDLGFEQDSLWYHVKDSRPEFDYGWRVESNTIFKMFTSEAKKRLIIYSAYTVAELGEILRTFEKEHWDQVPTWDTYFNKWYFQNGYGHGEIVKWLEADTEANARAQMLIYLKENNLLTTK